MKKQKQLIKLIMLAVGSHQLLAIWEEEQPSFRENTEEPQRIITTEMSAPGITKIRPDLAALINQPIEATTNVKQGAKNVIGQGPSLTRNLAKGFEGSSYYERGSVVTKGTEQIRAGLEKSNIPVTQPGLSPLKRQPILELREGEGLEGIKKIGLVETRPQPLKIEVPSKAPISESVTGAVTTAAGARKVSPRQQPAVRAPFGGDQPMNPGEIPRSLASRLTPEQRETMIQGNSLGRLSSEQRNALLREQQAYITRNQQHGASHLSEIAKRVETQNRPAHVASQPRKSESPRKINPER